jgi:hypothetical protein
MKTMKTYKNKVFYLCVMKGEFWVRFYRPARLRGKGFRVINTKKKKLRFSERHNYTKTFSIFNYNFKKLKRKKFVT